MKERLSLGVLMFLYLFQTAVGDGWFMESIPIHSEALPGRVRDLAEIKRLLQELIPGIEIEYDWDEELLIATGNPTQIEQFRELLAEG